jgi:hypothetical protein
VTARTDYFETSISWDKLCKDFRDCVSNRVPVPSNICSERTLDHHCNFFFNKETVVRNFSPSEVLPIFVELKLRDLQNLPLYCAGFSFYSLYSETIYVTMYCIFTNKKRTLLHNTKPIFLHNIYTHESQSTIRMCCAVRGTVMRQVTQCSLLRVRRCDRLYMNYYNISTVLNTLLNCLHAQDVCTYIQFFPY